MIEASSDCIYWHIKDVQTNKRSKAGIWNRFKMVSKSMKIENATSIPCWSIFLNENEGIDKGCEWKSLIVST